MMRASGILLPVSSLPSKYGIGCFSAEAYEFVDQLVRAGQKYWQILPLGPTGYGDSPYQSFSTFAGNPYFIDLEAFVKAGYLEESDCENCDWGGSESYVDYEKIYNSRFRLLRKAFENYDCEGDPEYQKFVERKEKTVAAVRMHCACMMDEISLYTGLDIGVINLIEWHIGRSVCTQNKADCKLETKDSQWLKPVFETCPFYNTCMARCYNQSYLKIQEPNYNGSSY